MTDIVHEEINHIGDKSAAARRFAETRNRADLDLRQAWQAWLEGYREEGDVRTGAQVVAALKAERHAKVEAAIAQLRKDVTRG